MYVGAEIYKKKNTDELPVLPASYSFSQLHDELTGGKPSSKEVCLTLDSYSTAIARTWTILMIVSESARTSSCPW